MSNANETKPKVRTSLSRIISDRDVGSLMLCVAGAWLYGTISPGRARELAKVLGHTAADIENLKFVEERKREEAHAE